MSWFNWQLLVARIKCHWWLLHYGMWRGYRRIELTAPSRWDSTVVLAAKSNFPVHAKHSHVFYRIPGLTDEHVLEYINNLD